MQAEALHQAQEVLAQETQRLADRSEAYELAMQARDAQTVGARTQRRWITKPNARACKSVPRPRNADSMQWLIGRAKNRSS